MLNTFIILTAYIPTQCQPGIRNWLPTSWLIHIDNFIKPKYTIVMENIETNMA